MGGATNPKSGVFSFVDFKFVGKVELELIDESSVLTKFVLKIFFVSSIIPTATVR